MKPARWPKGAALEVTNDFLEEIGVLSLLQRRMAAFVLGKREGASVLADELKRLLSAKSIKRNIRRMIARAVTDLALFPKEAIVSVWSLVLADGGRRGALGDDGLWAHDPAAGIDPNTGAHETLRVELVRATGYTAGATGLPETRRLPELLLIRATRFWNKLRAGAKEPIDPVKPATIRDWCTRGGPSRLNEIFEDACHRGTADKAANRVDRSKMLPG
jgi:hypothetical protein